MDPLPLTGQERAFVRPVWRKGVCELVHACMSLGVCAHAWGHVHVYIFFSLQVAP